jgi:hypothetical protein
MSYTSAKNIEAKRFDSPRLMLRSSRPVAGWSRLFLNWKGCHLSLAAIKSVPCSSIVSAYTEGTCEPMNYLA